MKLSNLLIACMLLPSIAFAQQTNIDSVCQHINAAKGAYIKALRLEHGLQYLSSRKISKDKFISKLSLSKMDSRLLLLLDSYDAKLWIRAGEFDKLTTKKNSLNPYVLFHVGNALYFTGQNDSALKTWRKGAAMTLEFQDSGFTSSMYTNIGAVNWMNDNLDSALIYFLKARDITDWYNETLEANILAITNTIGDYELSKKQVDLILSKDKESKSGPFLVNWIIYLQAATPEQLDSVYIEVQSRFKGVNKVPVELVATYVEMGWRSDSIFHLLGSMTPSSDFERAVEKLIYSPLLPEVTDSTLNVLAARTSDNEVAALLNVILRTDSAERLVLAKALMQQDGSFNESVERLKFTASKYKEDLEQLESKQSAVILASLITLLIVSLIIILQQRKVIKSGRAQKVLSVRKAKLEEVNSKLDYEIKQLRQSIQEFSSESLKEIQSFKKWVKTIETGDSGREFNTEDLTVISTYINGIQRFKIREYCQQMNSDGIKELSKILGSKEIEVIKLIAVGFKSKEVALLIDVTPQYINNIRHQIRKTLDENNLELESVIARIKGDLSFS